MTNDRRHHLAAMHQLSAAEEAGSVRYGLTRHPAIVVAIADRTLRHQDWAARYAAYGREQLGISDTEDQLYA
ncbi:hypothetical protein ELI01_18915 [Rhizobium leguminosarum]|uniref:hypothetical protein n=1 Tax=Rhizobium leguminosarum TaxID=384 RepID=UPI00102F7C8F|nr:hypothetical protein [Rhizobium leguminosarum]TAX57150.1 hypothetical protein ELI01_18915 [Rhizobium leguminosarum]